MLVLALLSLVACTGRKSPGTDSPVDSADTALDSDSAPETGRDSDTHGDTSPDCVLADPTGTTAIPLADGSVAALYYTEGDSPAMSDGYGVVLAIKGTTGSGGVPVVTPYATAGFGFVQVYANLPRDRRGAESRAAVASAARFAAGLEPDADGCYVADVVSVALSATPPSWLGHSNGGNMAIAALADPALDVPDPSGIVMFETPISSQFVDVELGEIDQVNPLYLPGGCDWEIGVGLSCAYAATPTLGWDGSYQDGSTGPVGAVFFDADGDGLKSADEYPVFGVTTVVDEPTVAFSPELTAMLEDQGVTGPVRLDLADAEAWWAERDGSRMAGAAQEAHPGVPLIVIGTEDDHVAGVSDHAHVTAAAQVWRDTGSPWVRVNPASQYMDEVAGAGPAWTDNPPNLATFLGNDAIQMEPDELVTGVAPDRYCTAALLELMARTESGDWAE